jgi:carbonic anhydrase
MSSTTNKSPIDIVENVSNCSLKCNFSFKYSSSKILTIINKGNYINIEVERTNEPPVTFNNERYNVESIRIYTPSLHTYGGNNADAEMIISHTNDNSDSILLICIPISVNNVINDNSAILSKIILEMSKRANSLGEKTVIQEERFSLNNIVPRKPFFFYEGVLPYSPNNGNANFIVYNMDNAIPINDKMFKILKSMIVSQNTDVYPTNGRLFYNNKGPFYNNNTADTEDIYIDCRPTGSDGNVIVPISDETKFLETPNIFGNINSDIIKQILKVLFAGIILFLLMKAIFMAITYGDDKDFSASTVLNPFSAFFTSK